MAFLRRKAKPATFAAAGKTIACPHCDGTLFLKSEAWWDGPVNHGRFLDLLRCTTCGRQVLFDKGSTQKTDA